MPLQNRVTPFGEILAMPERGLFIGNRGIIHDPATKTLLKTRWTTKAWLVCTRDYKGIRRNVMGGRSWTELFFLDEATALAAGHRPCFECRRVAAEAFRKAWTEGNGAAVKASAIDEALHRERLDGRFKQLHRFEGEVPQLPDGTFVAAVGNSFLVAGGRLLRWTPGGYEAAGPATKVEALITPPSTVRTLAHGYKPVLHPSAEAA